MTYEPPRYPPPDPEPGYGARPGAGAAHGNDAGDDHGAGHDFGTVYGGAGNADTTTFAPVPDEGYPHEGYPPPAMQAAASEDRGHGEPVYPLPAAMQAAASHDPEQNASPGAAEAPGNPPLSAPASPPGSVPPSAPPAYPPGGVPPAYPPGGVPPAYPPGGTPPVAQSGQAAGQQPGMPSGQQPGGPGYVPPASSPAYATGQAPVAPAKGTNWKIPIIIGAVVLVLCCIGAIVAGFGVFNVFKDATGATKSAAVAYLDDVQNGNYGSAYERLCENVKRDLTPQEFAQLQSLLPPITGYEITGVNVMTSAGKTTGTVDAEITRDGVGRINQTVQLVKEDGQWRVCQRGV